MKQQLTKNAIQSSFIRLLTLKSFDKITVRDIVEDCGLTRNAFYYYYDDIYDVVEEFFTTEIQKLIENPESSGSFTELLTSGVRYSMEFRKMVQHLYRSNKRTELSTYIGKSIEKAINHFIEGCRGENEINEDDRRLICNVYRHAILGILTEWGEAGMNDDIIPKLERIGVLFDSALKEAVLRSTAK